MKKMLFVLGVATVAMTSCSNDEVVEMNQSSLIQFETFVNKGTRAVTDVTNPTINDGIHESGLNKFFVYGYRMNDGNRTNVFDGIPVTWVNKNGDEGNKWTYNEGAHTPWTGGNYYFAAYANENNANEALDNTVTFTEGALKIASYEVNDAQDLVAAWANVDFNSIVSHTVSLNFQHMLSKVYFEITNGDNENLSMTISDITINVKPSGDCTYDGTSITWDNLTTFSDLTFNGTGTYSKDNTNTFISTGNYFTSTDHLVIPGQNITENQTAAVTASFTVNFYNQAGLLMYTKECNDISLDIVDGWKPGLIYKYTTSVTATMPTIEFGVSVEGWPNDATDTPINN